MFDKIINHFIHCMYKILNREVQRNVSLTKGQRPKRLQSISAVHGPFYISICISTLPTQHTTFKFKERYENQNIGFDLLNTCYYSTSSRVVLFVLYTL